MKKNILILFILMVLIVPFKVSAVDLEKSFEMSFDATTSQLMIINSYDDAGNVDGYIIFNRYGIRNNYFKLDLHNKIVWDKPSTETTIKELRVTINDNDNLLVKKINPDTNEVLWQREYGGSGKEFFVDNGLYSYDNSGEIDGYLIRFRTASLDLGFNPGYYVIKYDLNGNIKWVKKYVDYGEWYMQREDGDWLRYYDSGSTHGMYALGLDNITKATFIPAPIVSQGEFSAFSVEDKEMVICWLERNSRVKKLTMLSLEQEKLVEKDVDSTFELYSGIVSKTVTGKKDGIYLLTNSGIIKTDYEFNELSKIELAYTGSDIYESYDDNGDFNGYIVVGYDKDNKKGYVTKFTYPKKTIESKNDDVEVVSDSYPGKTVTLAPKEKAGYYVKRVIVRDSSGKEIEVSSDNTFVMPDDDVTIEVVYEKRETETIINPDTASTISIVLVIAAIIIVGTVAVRSRNYLEK